MCIVGLNERGNPVGEYNHRAVLSDHEIDLVRELREGDPGFWTYELLAEKFEVSKACIADICKYRRRAQHPCKFREKGKSPRR